MKTKGFIPLLYLLFLGTLSACKKDKDSDPVIADQPLYREFSLQYNNDTDWTQKSFGTLEDQADFVFNWPDAKSKSSLIHFGVGVFAGKMYILAPDEAGAEFVYKGVFGVLNWPVRKGITFNKTEVNTNFDVLTKTSIDTDIPDMGFGGLGSTSVEIVQLNKIFQFIYRDKNDVLKYKGYIKVTANIINNPKTASVTVKYIAK